MKTLQLIVLAAFTLLFSQCKSPTQATQGVQPSLREVAQILDTTQKKFLEFADQTVGNPWQAIMLTTAWVKTQPSVETAESLDSVSINILLKSGLQSTFSFVQTDSSGRSLFKGGGGDGLTREPKLIKNDVLSKNSISNKKVLFYLPAFSEFYTASQFQKILDYFSASGLGLDVTVLKDNQCTYNTLETFKDYGLVIIDTHGGPDSYLTGTKISRSNLDLKDTGFQSIVQKQVGSDCYSRLLSGDLQWNGFARVNLEVPQWQKNVQDTGDVGVWVTTRYIDALPPMSNTVIVGNMCYSGESVLFFSGHTPIKTSFVNKSPISYYGYAFNDGTSGIVSTPFSDSMLDNFIQSLVKNNDSTGKANLQPNGTEYSDAKQLPKFLFFKHFGANNYSYSNCIDHFTDARDGHVYKAVCIGDQIWMAENLDYDTPGSYDYNNDPANGKIYGKLYDFTTLMQGAQPSNKIPSGVRGVCPQGWHVPSDSEFAVMTKFVSASNVATGGALKSTSSLWQSPNVGATNSSGFSALPGGNGSAPSTFSLIGQNAFFNTSTATIAPTYIDPTIYGLSAFGSGISHDIVGDGLRSCRCVKDP